MRNAPPGFLTIRKRLPPEAAVRSALLLQDRWRTVRALLHGVERRVIHKADASLTLGISLSAEFSHHSVIAKTKPSSIAGRAFSRGDLIRSINGVACGSPAETAQRLREAVGQIELHVTRRRDVDYEAICEMEDREREVREWEAREATIDRQHQAAMCLASGVLDPSDNSLTALEAR